MTDPDELRAAAEALRSSRGEGDAVADWLDSFADRMGDGAADPTDAEEKAYGHGRQTAAYQVLQAIRPDLEDQGLVVLREGGGATAIALERHRQVGSIGLTAPAIGSIAGRRRSPTVGEPIKASIGREPESFDVWCPDGGCADASSFRSRMVETRPGLWECPECGATANEATDVIEPAPDDGLPEGAFRATADVIVMPTGSVYAPWVVTRGGFEITGEWCDADHLREVFGITPPKPPWTSPLPNLPDLTEQDCWYAVKFLDEFPESDCMVAQIGRALKAADWTPEEADRG